ncbi:hypothetical protein BC941DRAFT_433640 [Chlamydoabsidia padenii]|nr:hypothetical protein BC941DRAFT_433640 [Chlamydoabsidia padenii]
MEQPSLSELNIFATEPTEPKYKALCENIFDVPRSNLLDVLETLQEAFWTDEPHPTQPPPPPPPPQQPDQPHPTKRARQTSPVEYHQPTSPSPPSSPLHRIMSSPPVYASIKPLPPTTTEPTLTLWTVKWLLFKQLKSSYPVYKEKEVLALWQRFQHQGTKTEIRHLANYLLPVACAMRRWTVAQSFRQVLQV